jgi:hypothetical protein
MVSPARQNRVRHYPPAPAEALKLAARISETACPRAHRIRRHLPGGRAVPQLCECSLLSTAVADRASAPFATLFATFNA